MTQPNQPRAKQPWEKAVDQGLAIVEMIDDDLPEGAENAAEFFEDVREKVSAVIETIEQRRAVTEKQKAALDGWERGVQAWIK